ncbi:MAG: tetratricopeptide repeat protein, partial [Deltaproteobacteria bacterium]|nr:tetratricopeptide repeat protein [Deltaproteobacteria bacterium]
RPYSRIAMCGLSALGIAGLVYSFPDFAESFKDRRYHLASDSRAINRINVQTGKWLAQNTPANAVVGVNDAGAIRYFGHRFTIDLIGLNNAGIAFHKVGFKQAMGKIDWLAVFPGWFSGVDTFPPPGFGPRTIFGIPFHDYTICPWLPQTMIAILEKRPGAPAHPPGPSRPLVAEKLQSAKDRLERGLIEAAIQDLTLVLIIDPKNAEGFYYRGAAYLQHGQYKQAIPDLTQALRINPLFASAYEMRGAAMLAGSWYREGCLDLERACALGRCQGMEEYSEIGRRYGFW